MQPFPDLLTLQTLMSRLIRAPEGVARGAEDLVDTGELPSGDLSFMIEPNDRMTETQRLDVYANMYFYRLHDCLCEDFPKTRERLGPTHFNNLVTDYLLAHPPTHYSLREVGRALPEFLAGHAPTDEFAAICDLAALEWARVDVFDEADAPALDRDALVRVSADAPETTFIRAVPAIRLLQIDEAALYRWESPDAGHAPSSRDAQPRSIVVWRKGFAVHHRPAVPDETHCLEALTARDLSLADLAELLLAHDRSAEETAERFAALLELWLADGLLSRRDA
jgi:hypothetical protein